MAKTQTEAVTFHSKYPGLRVVVRPIRVTITDGIRVVHPGKTAEFNRGEFTTSDPEVIEYLRNHGTYGQDYFDTVEAMQATSNLEEIQVTAADRPEIAKPVRTRKGERAAVKAKATTAEDLDDGSALTETDDLDD